MNISIIAAIGKNRELGFQNRLQWHIPADLKRLKNITTGHTVIMGRRTFESIGNRPLPNRQNIIITHQSDFQASNYRVAHSVSEVLQMTDTSEEVFIMGGARIYEQFLPYTQKMYLTRIHYNYIADTFFPEFNEDDWEIIELKDIKGDKRAGVDYSFITLRRK
jgi:dihydrofolate reductase